jgi:hypothetical protein
VHIRSKLSNLRNWVLKGSMYGVLIQNRVMGMWAL